MTDKERLELHKETLESEGFFDLQIIEGRGICGLMKFMFTLGLCEGIATNGFDTYEGRYCYPYEYSTDAIVALRTWNGKDDPIGRWAKYKGKKGEYGRTPDPFEKQ